MKRWAHLVVVLGVFIEPTAYLISSSHKGNRRNGVTLTSILLSFYLYVVLLEVKTMSQVIKPLAEYRFIKATILCGKWELAGSQGTGLLILLFQRQGNCYRTAALATASLWAAMLVVTLHTWKRCLLCTLISAWDIVKHQVFHSPIQGFCYKVRKCYETIQYLSHDKIRFGNPIIENTKEHYYQH